MADIFTEFQQPKPDIFREFHEPRDPERRYLGELEGHYREQYPGLYTGTKGAWQSFRRVGGRPEERGLEQARRGPAAGALGFGIPGVAEARFPSIQVPEELSEGIIRGGTEIGAGMLTGGPGFVVGGAGAEAGLRGLKELTGEDVQEPWTETLARGARSGTISAVSGLAGGVAAQQAGKLASRIPGTLAKGSAGLGADVLAGTAAQGLMEGRMPGKEELGMATALSAAFRGVPALGRRSPGFWGKELGDAGYKPGPGPSRPVPPQAPPPDAVRTPPETEGARFGRQVEEYIRQQPPEPQARPAPTPPPRREGPEPLLTPEDEALVGRAQERLQRVTKNDYAGMLREAKGELESAQARYDEAVKAFQALEPPTSVGEEYRRLAKEGSMYPRTGTGTMGGAFGKGGKWIPEMAGGAPSEPPKPPAPPEASPAPEEPKKPRKRVKLGKEPTPPGEEGFTEGHKEGLVSARHVRKEAAKSTLPGHERRTLSDPQEAKAAVESFGTGIVRVKFPKNPTEKGARPVMRDFIGSRKPPTDPETGEVLHKFELERGAREETKAKHNLMTLWETDEAGNYLREGDNYKVRSFQYDKALTIEGLIDGKRVRIHYTPKAVKAVKLAEPEPVKPAERPFGEPSPEVQGRGILDVPEALEAELRRKGAQKAPRGEPVPLPQPKPKPEGVRGEGPPWAFAKRGRVVKGKPGETEVLPSAGRLAARYGRAQGGVAAERMKVEPPKREGKVMRLTRRGLRKAGNALIRLGDILELPGRRIDAALATVVGSAYAWGRMKGLGKGLAIIGASKGAGALVRRGGTALRRLAHDPTLPEKLRKAFEAAYTLEPGSAEWRAAYELIEGSDAWQEHVRGRGKGSSRRSYSSAR